MSGPVSAAQRPARRRLGWDDVLPPGRLSALREGRLPTVAVLGALLGIDAVFMVLYVVHARSGRLPDGLFSLDVERSLAAWYQFGKTAAVCAALVVLAERIRSAVLVLWAAVFLYALVDDVFELHEGAGRFAQDHLGVGGVAELSGEDLGQLLFAVVVGVALLTSLLYLHARSSGQARRLSLGLLLLGALFVGFAVGVDAVHAALLTWSIGTRLILLEEGGELVVMSLVLAYAWHWLRSTSSSEARFG
jgi:hypothetical protein